MYSYCEARQRTVGLHALVVLQSLFLVPLCSTVKLVETDCVHAVLASFVGVARQGGGATESAIEHLKLLLKLAPKGMYVCMYVELLLALISTSARFSPLLQSPWLSLVPPPYRPYSHMYQ